MSSGSYDLCKHRRIIDVDSHVIELDDFLHNAARAEHIDLVPSMFEQKALQVTQAGLDRGRELFAKRQSDPAVMAKFEASLMDNTKSVWNRLGAFDAKERSHTLDLLGFEMQWYCHIFLPSNDACGNRGCFSCIFYDTEQSHG